MESQGPVHTIDAAALLEHRAWMHGLVVLTMLPKGSTRLAIEVVERTGRRVPRFRVMTSVRVPTGAEGGTASWSTFSHDETNYGQDYDIEIAVGLPLHVQVSVPGLVRGCGGNGGSRGVASWDRSVLRGPRGGQEGVPRATSGDRRPSLRRWGGVPRRAGRPAVAWSGAEGSETPL